MELPAGIPSHDTLNRVFRHLDPVELERCLTQWDQTLVALLAGRQLVVDSKQLRGTIERGHQQVSVQLVSVWAAEQRLCLAHTQVADKRNELTALPQVLAQVAVVGSVVSIDAMGCQREVAATLVARDADYVLALEQNHGTLHTRVAAHFAPLLAQPAAHAQCDKGHGRGELRQVWVSQGLGLVNAGAGWAGLRTVICVRTTRWRDGQVERATRYFLSSLAGASAATLAGYVRRHCSIENEQHWHLDITFAEDACTCRREHAPRNLSTMRKLALTLLHQLPLKMSLKRKRKKAARDDGFLHQLLAQLPTQESIPAS